MKTKFTVTVLATCEKETPTCFLARDFTFEAETGELHAKNVEKFRQSLTEFLDAVSTPEGRTSSRQVYVLHVDNEVFREKYFEDTAKRLPANETYAQLVVPGMEFPSALAASRHLGLKHNEVAMYLGKLAHLKDPTERRAVIRGVTLTYVDDYNETLIANARCD